MLEQIKKLAAENGWSDEDLKQALAWITNPTIRPLVGIREFCESPHYMNALRDDGTSVIWPKVMIELEKANSGDYDTVVCSGAIGAAKTTFALYSLAYQLYLLSCYDDPHSLYGLDPSTEIAFIFQSVSAKSAKDVDYQRFRAMIEKSPYFKQYFPFDPDLESELKFPKRVVVRPVSSKETAAIGQNVFGGLIDEVNFMQLIDKSKSSIDGGAYDQAVALYNSISKRRASRFGKLGSLPGLLCVVSSARYPGQFTDKLVEEAKAQIAATGKTRIFVYHKRVWDVCLDDRYCGEFFQIFVGDQAHRPRIIDADGPRTYEVGKLDSIPVEHRMDFERDVMGALRDIAGISTVAKHPFFIDLEAVNEAFGKTGNLLSKVRCTLMEDDTIVALVNNLRNKDSPRFVHIDLAITGDSAGMCMGHVEKFIEIRREAQQYEVLPLIVIDFALEIPPPKGGEIPFHRIREILYNLKDRMHIPINWVTLDSFQSKDTMQILRQRGFATGYQSIDLTNDPYVFTKAAFYDRRIQLPVCNKLQTEISALEKDTKTNKIDHPPKGSKDISDALAGVVYGLTMRREVWAHFSVPLYQSPGWLTRARLEAAGSQDGELPLLMESI